MPFTAPNMQAIESTAKGSWKVQVSTDYFSPEYLGLVSHLSNASIERLTVAIVIAQSSDPHVFPNRTYTRRP